MKYVTLTFDDGRKDNIEFAAPIVKKYSIPAVLFCTTGFIDGTWKKPEDGWKSVSTALSVDDLFELKQQGWEIGLHGDKHITEYEDWKTAIEKLTAWGLFSDSVAFSVPDSQNCESKIHGIRASDIGKKISFIRCGRGIDTKKLWSRVLYAAYSVLKLQKAYNAFNKPSCNSINGLDKNQVKSVVVKRTDNPEMLLHFISQMPDNTWIVFMLHSVLPKNSSLYRADNWTWSDDSFKTFVSGLADLQRRCSIQVTGFDLFAKEP